MFSCILQTYYKKRFCFILQQKIANLSIRGQSSRKTLMLIVYIHSPSVEIDYPIQA